MGIDAPLLFFYVQELLVIFSKFGVFMIQTGFMYMHTHTRARARTHAHTHTHARARTHTTHTHNTHNSDLNSFLLIVDTTFIIHIWWYLYNFSTSNICLWTVWNGQSCEERNWTQNIIMVVISLPVPFHCNVGTPALCATILEAILSPRDRMAFAGGPIKVMLHLASRSGSLGFSLAWPHPAQTA